ncbi:MAG TPA: hypothetical protein VGC95_07320, partial [Chitinophagaceae bacterium]
VAVDASISVYLLDSLQQPDADLITSYFLLSAELHGRIENASYYLDSSGSDVLAATDHLMLTQGWRKFEADERGSGTVYLPEHEGHLVSGRVTDKRTGEPAAGKTVYLAVPGKNFRFTTATSDDSGNVRFNLPSLVGSEELVVQLNQLLDSNYRVTVFSPFSDRFAAAGNAQLPFHESESTSLLNRSISTQVVNAYRPENQKRFLIEGFDTIPFYGTADKVYDLDDYTRFTTMEEVLREYVPDIAPRKHRNSFHLKVTNADAVFFEQNPLVLADGVPFFNMDTVIAFDPLKIKTLEVVDRKYYFGPDVFYGIVSYSTYKGDLDGIRLDPGAVVVDYEGMQFRREYYSPRYDTDADRRSHLPDFRSTILWKPDLLLEGQRSTTTTLFTSDLPGRYLIILNGLSPAGTPVSAVSQVSVR